MSKPFYALLSLLVMLGCTEVEKKYYPNGQIESEIEVKNGMQEGKTKTYYSDGKLKYEGSYKSGRRIGKHTSYYPEGNVKREYEYVMENGKERFVYKKEYGKDGLLSFESFFSKKEVVLLSKESQVFLGDTIHLKLRILNPTYGHCMIILGSYDENLSIQHDDDTSHVSFMGKDHEVEFWTVAKKSGPNKLTGIVRDFRIKMLNDTLGYTSAEDSYFEYYFRVLEKELL